MRMCVRALVDFVFQSVHAVGVGGERALVGLLRELLSEFPNYYDGSLGWLPKILDSRIINFDY